MLKEKNKLDLQDISEYEIEHYLREKKISIDIIYGWSFSESFELDKSWDFGTLFEKILEKSSVIDSIIEKRMYWIYRYDHIKEQYLPVQSEKNVFFEIIELEYENFYLDEYPSSNDIYYKNFFERRNSNFYDRYLSFHLMRRIFSPYIINSVSNNCSNLNDTELNIIFHQLRHLYLKNNISNIISYNDSYTMQYLLRKVSENYILFEKNFFTLEGDLLNHKDGINNRKDKIEVNKIEKVYNEFLGRKIKEINKNDDFYKTALDRYKTTNGENDNYFDFDMNYFSFYKFKDKFYRDYISKINLNDQKDSNLRELFENKNGSQTFRHFYKNFVSIFENYKNLLSDVYYCIESIIKVSPLEYSNIAQFNLPGNFFMLINFNNIHLIDSKLDILFSINYSDLVYIYQGQNNEVLLGVYYSLEEENKDQKEDIELNKNMKKLKDNSFKKTNKSFELFIKIRSDDSRLIIEDIISYCELILAINTNSDFFGSNEKSIFKRLENLESLENMNSYSINSNLIKSNKAYSPFDLKDFKLIYQKKLPYLEHLRPEVDDGIDIESFFKNEAIEAIRNKKNISDINKSYNSKSILNDLISNIDEKKQHSKRRSTIVDKDIIAIRKITEDKRRKRTYTTSNRKLEKKSKNNTRKNSKEKSNNDENTDIKHISFKENTNAQNSKINYPRKSNLNNFSIKSINVGENKKDFINKPSINKPHFKESLKDEKNKLVLEERNLNLKLNDGKNQNKQTTDAVDDESIRPVNNKVRNDKKSVVLAKSAANQAMAILPKSMLSKTKSEQQNSIIPNMN